MALYIATNTFITVPHGFLYASMSNSNSKKRKKKKKKATSSTIRPMLCNTSFRDVQTSLAVIAHMNLGETT